jgi:hypothetical protein
MTLLVLVVALLSLGTAAPMNAPAPAAATTDGLIPPASGSWTADVIGPASGS